MNIHIIENLKNITYVTLPYNPISLDTTRLYIKEHGTLLPNIYPYTENLYSISGENNIVFSDDLTGIIDNIQSNPASGYIVYESFNPNSNKQKINQIKTK